MQQVVTDNIYRFVTNSLPQAPGRRPPPTANPSKQRKPSEAGIPAKPNVYRLLTVCVEHKDSRFKA